MGGWSPSVLEVVLEIHADAWQEQVERLERERETLHGQIDGETKALLARIEALEETVCGAKAIIDDLEGQLNRSLEEP